MSISNFIISLKYTAWRDVDIMKENKKGAILAILKVLQEYSDEEHYLTQQDIIDHLAKDPYNIKLERKSVSDSLKILGSDPFNYDIIKKDKAGYALGERLLDASQIKFLDDAIVSSRVLTQHDAKKILDALNSTMSKHEQLNFDITKTPALSKPNDLNKIFYTISIIQEAMRNKKKFSFIYLEYKEDGKLHSKKENDRRYYASPYYLVNNLGKYYLLCGMGRHGGITTFKVDYISNPIIEEDDMVPMDSEDKFDITKYQREHIYMYDDETFDVRIKIEKPSYIADVMDWFGSEADIKKDEGDGFFYFTVKSDKNSIIYWLLQYGDKFTLVSPDSLIEDLKKALRDQLAKY